MPASTLIAGTELLQPSARPPQGAASFFFPAAFLRRALPVVVAALVLLGLLARLRQYAAGASYWYDEAYLLLNIFDKDWRELLGPLRDNQAGPPVYFWSLRAVYRAAGPSEWVMRLPAFLASLLALFVMVPVARRFLPHAGWLWAVGFCATCKQAADRGAEVKPYAWDFLFTLLILLAAQHGLSADAPRRFRRCLGLFALAVVAPWCSLPSVFVLGGASLALLYRAVCSRTRFAWCIWAGFNLLCLASAASLYYLALRHQRTAALDQYWEDFFGDVSSPGNCLAWLVGRVVRIGQYGSNGLGVPLLLFALAGGWLLGRRAPVHLILLAGPLVLGMAASLLRRYPLDGRLAFFVVPCLYLLAAEGMGTLAERACSGRCPRRLAGMCLGGLTLLLVPGIGPAAQMAVLSPEPGFREAFVYAHRHSEAGDLYWVSHPQVFEAYFRGQETCLGSSADNAEVVTQARGRRLWLISTRTPLSEPLERRLHEAGFVLSDAYRSRGYVALLYVAAKRTNPQEEQRGRGPTCPP